MTNNITRDHIIADLSSELVELKAALRDFVGELRDDASKSLADFIYEPTSAGDHEDDFRTGWDVGHARGLQSAARRLEGLIP